METNIGKIKHDGKEFDVVLELPKDIDKPKRLTAVQRIQLFWVNLINSQKK